MFRRIVRRGWEDTNTVWRDRPIWVLLWVLVVDVAVFFLGLPLVDDPMWKGLVVLTAGSLLAVGIILVFFILRAPIQIIRSQDSSIRSQASSGLRLHVETDPGIFLAGELNWDAFGYVVPTTIANVGPPPGQVCRDWHNWATGLGGIPARWQRVRLTLIGAGERTVVVDGLRVTTHRTETDSSGSYVLCRAGGAEAVPRGFRVEFDLHPPLVTAVEPGGDSAKRLLLTLAPGEVEILEIEAQISRGSVKWSCELLLIVDGIRQVLAVDGPDGPFRIAGTPGLTAYEWDGETWQVIEGSEDW